MSAGVDRKGEAAGLDDESTLVADRASVRALRQGDREAYAGLVHRHLPRLHALLRRFFREQADVDDLAQAAFLRAYEQLDRYDASRPFYPWLRRIAMNLALHEIDKRKRRREEPDPEISLATERANERSDQPAQERELIAATQAELDAMPPRWAAVFRLRAFEELSYAEIAETLGIPIGSVMSSLARARARLAEALAQRYGPRLEEP